MYYEALKVRQAPLLLGRWVGHLPPVRTQALSAAALLAPPPQGAGQQKDKQRPSPPPRSVTSHTQSHNSSQTP